MTPGTEDELAALAELREVAGLLLEHIAAGETESEEAAKALAALQEALRSTADPSSSLAQLTGCEERRCQKRAEIAGRLQSRLAALDQMVASGRSRTLPPEPDSQARATGLPLRGAA